MSIQTTLLFTCCLLSFSLTSQSEVYKTTPLGTKYRITKPALPEPGSHVYFHVEMRTQRDSIMFSTRGRDIPTELTIPTVVDTLGQIGPIEDVLRYLRLGDRTEIIANIKGFPNLPPGMEHDTIVYYDVEVIEIISSEEFMKREAVINEEKEKRRALALSRSEECIAFHKAIVEKYRSGNLENIMVTESGLKYVIHEKGDGPIPENDEKISVHYIGSLVTGGEPFDVSFQRGDPIKFDVGSGRVIAGWDEGLQLLTHGTKATLFIPAKLAYGASGTPDGSIPPNTEIAYYVELE